MREGIEPCQSRAANDVSEHVWLWFNSRPAHFAVSLRSTARALPDVHLASLGELPASALLYYRTSQRRSCRWLFVPL